MNMNDNYQKIYELVEGDFFASFLKRGRKFEETGNYVFWYVDVDDFSEFNFSQEEEIFLVDCLRQKGIVVYDRYGNEYANNFKLEEMVNHDYNYENKQVIFDKLRLYHKNKDIKIRNELIMDNMQLVERIAKKISNEYQISYEDLVQLGTEYLIHIIEEYDVKKIEDFFHYSYIRMMKYLLRKAINIFDYNNQSKKIIRDYLDAKKNVESIYGETLDENPELMDEIIDLMIEEHGSDNKLFYNSDKLLNYNKKLSNSEYNHLLTGNYRNTKDGYKYRYKVNANLEHMGLDELLDQFDVFKYDEYVLYDKNKIISKLMDAINELSERDQRIIRMRYGLDDGQCMSLKYIGRKLGRSMQLIGAKEKKIINKLNARLIELIDFELLSEYFLDSQENEDISKRKR